VADGSSVNVSATTSSPHVGTHADAPLHVADGAPGSHELPLEAFIGEALVVDVSECEQEISTPLLRKLGVETGARRLLLKTGRSISGGTFPASWPVLSGECARELTRHGLKLLGVDAPSVDHRGSKSLDVHKMLFGGGACIVENLDLRAVPAGRYELLALPMRVEGLDAAPLRAILRATAQS